MALLSIHFMIACTLLLCSAFAQDIEPVELLNYPITTTTSATINLTTDAPTLITTPITTTTSATINLTTDAPTLMHSTSEEQTTTEQFSTTTPEATTELFTSTSPEATTITELFSSETPEETTTKELYSSSSLATSTSSTIAPSTTSPTTTIPPITSTTYLPLRTTFQCTTDTVRCYYKQICEPRMIFNGIKFGYKLNCYKCCCIADYTTCVRHYNIHCRTYKYL